MTLQRFAMVVLFFFVAGIVSVTADEISRSLGGGVQVTHSEGSHCPDPLDSGHPCGPACTCTCCPGHGVGLVFVAEQLSLGVSLINVLKPETDDDLYPRDICRRIFHPPRT